MRSSEIFFPDKKKCVVGIVVEWGGGGGEVGMYRRRPLNCKGLEHHNLNESDSVEYKA